MCRRTVNLQRCLHFMFRCSQTMSERSTEVSGPNSGNPENLNGNMVRLIWMRTRQVVRQQMCTPFS